MRSATRLAWIVACVAHRAVADDSSQASQQVPSFARDKPRVEDVDHKTAGSFLSGLPLVGYDTSTGLGLGVGGYYTMDGKKDGLFTVTPYRHRIYVQAYATTGGYQQHMISYDGIYVGNSPYRVRATIEYERNTSANYFGASARETLPNLSFDGVSHTTYDDQQAAASMLRGLYASPNYNHYEYDRPSGSVTLERDFWGGRVRALYGFTAQYSTVNKYDYTETQGTDANGNSVPAIHGLTLLGMDCDAARAVSSQQWTRLGCGGGWSNGIKAGIALDTRDFEPDPTKGVFVDASGEWVTKALGSTYDYLRFTVAARGYWSPLPKLTHLVLALRLMYSMQTSEVPFYSLDTLALTEGDQSGVGGERTLRGYRQSRFVGPISAIANLEVRWTFVRFKLLNQLFSIQIAPLFDLGTVVDDFGDFPTTTWKYSIGGGLRIGWNRSTIIMFDAAASPEDVGMYIDFGMPF